MDFEGVSRRGVLGGVVAAMAGGGCLASGQRPKPRASDWPQRGYDAGGTNFKSVGDPPIDDPTIAWETQVSTAWPETIDAAHLLVADGTVYTSGGTVLSLETGAVRAQTDCVGPSLRAVAQTTAYSDGVLVADGLGRNIRPLVGIRPSFGSGTSCETLVRWRAGARSDIDPLIEDIRVTDGEILATVHALDAPEPNGRSQLLSIDPNDGAINWWRPLADVAQRLYVDETYVYVHHGLLDTDDGGIEHLFEVVDRGTQETVYEHLPDVDGHWMAAEYGVFLGVRDGVAYRTDFEHREETPHFAPHLVAFDVEAGEPRWRVDLTEYEDYESDVRPDNPFNAVFAAAIAPDTVFVSFGHGMVGAFSTADGSVRWTRERDLWDLTATPDALYGRHHSTLYCLDAGTGETRFSGGIGEGKSAGPPVVAGSRLLVQFGQRLVALEAA